MLINSVGQKTGEKPHSADYFGDSRDFWWNRDFLALMSTRWDLGEVKSLLDVGCGVGHWGRCLAPFLRADCVLTGVDREMRWVEEARRRSAEAGDRTSNFFQGDVTRLPFPDESFDMVTCQTVLIHVPDPIRALREMIRVLAPGGLIVVVEPNNTAGGLCGQELRRPVKEALKLLEFQMICERGKMNLAEGFISCGPWVPGWFSELGIEEIQSHLADKTTMLLPPYDSAHASAVIREAKEALQRAFWIWNREDAFRYFHAGGGCDAEFENLWRMAIERGAELLSAAEKGELMATFTPICVLASGRKKRPNHALVPTNSAIAHL